MVLKLVNFIFYVAVVIFAVLIGIFPDSLIILRLAITFFLAMMPIFILSSIIQTKKYTFTQADKGKNKITKLMIVLFILYAIVQTILTYAGINSPYVDLSLFIIYSVGFILGIIKSGGLTKMENRLEKGKPVWDDK